MQRYQVGLLIPIIEKYGYPENMRRKFANSDLKFHSVLKLSAYMLLTIRVNKQAIDAIGKIRKSLCFSSFTPPDLSV